MTPLSDLGPLRGRAVDDRALQPQRRTRLVAPHLQADRVRAVRELVLPERDVPATRGIGRQLDGLHARVVDEHVHRQHVILAVLAADATLDGEADALEGEARLVALRGAGEPDFRHGVVPLEVLLESDGLRGLDRNHDDVTVLAPASAPHHLERVLVRKRIGIVQRDGRVLEGRALDLGKSLLPVRRDALVAEDGPEDARGRRRVAVGVLAGPGRDRDRPAHVALAIEQAEHDVRRVDARVDVEGGEHAVRAADVLRVLALQLEPGPLPVGRVLVVQANDGADGLVEAAGRRNRVERPRHDGAHVVVHERERVHGRDEDAAVPAVARVHDVADLVGVRRGRVGQPWRHEPDEVGLDLEVDVVGLRVVAPIARCLAASGL